MANNLKKIPGFDDIVFEIRNKEYGAYQLRKNYNRNLLIAILIGSFILGNAVIIPFFTAKAGKPKVEIIEKQGPIVLQGVDNLIDKVAPPPPPPAPEPEMKQTGYLPPEIVDSVKTDESDRILTADEAFRTLKDLKVTDPVIKDFVSDIPVIEPEPEIHIVVEEMPVFPGGNEALLRYIAEHVVYPETPMQNNIQGKVYVKFCVTSTGSIDRISILKGVDPGLDEEAVRVVSTFPSFIPGKQNGVPVSVWYTAVINFKLKY